MSEKPYSRKTLKKRSQKVTGHTLSCDDVKELIRDIDPDAYTKPKLSASKAERKTAKAARREEVNRRKAVQEETSLIAMRVFEKLLETTDEDSQSKQVATDVSTGSDLYRMYRELLANSMAHARRFS